MKTGYIYLCVCTHTYIHTLIPIDSEMKLPCQFCIADMNLNLDTKMKILLIANGTFYSSHEPLNSSMSMVHTHSAVAK